MKVKTNIKAGLTVTLDVSSTTSITSATTVKFSYSDEPAAA
jgi:hypothetical protein